VPILCNCGPKAGELFSILGVYLRGVTQNLEETIMTNPSNPNQNQGQPSNNPRPGQQQGGGQKPDQQNQGGGQPKPDQQQQGGQHKPGQGGQNR
jgi:hypothetical protein